MSKKKMFAMMTLVIILAILGTGTLAYLTTRAVVHNVITSGGVGITLLEEFPDAGEDKKLEGVMPGDSYRKAVKVRNDQEEAWIRVRVTVSLDKDLPADKLTIVYNEGELENQWTKKDEWFYYNSPVATGQETSYLFESVSFDGPNMGNDYQNTEFTVEVDAQAVQTANNGATVLEAAGWP